MFVNRKNELKFLEERLRSNKAEFIVIYGRRRIGKTALLLELIRRHGGVYLLARETSKIENLKRFSKRISEYFKDDFLQRNPFRDWDSFFEYLNQRVTQREIIVIDEFPYLVKGDRSLPSILQEYWDLKLSRGNIFLVICGSSVSMMEKLLGYKSPIYGRRTAQLNLKPVDFFSTKYFLMGYSTEDLVRSYGILGGTPAYLLEFNDKISIEENLLHYFKNSSFLYQDAFFVLREELDEPRNYFAIMEVVAKGKTTLGEIMNETGLDRATVGKYLSVLIDLSLIRRDIPVTASWKSRKGRYYINDFYFDFWFRYVHPNVELIETDQGNLLVTLVMKDFKQYIGRVFEEIAKQFLIKLNISRELPFVATKIGKWWYKNEEIDIVALNENEKIASFIEVKWKNLNEKDTKNILDKLKRKAKILGLDEWTKFYGVIAKKIVNKEKFKKDGQFTWDLNDLENYFFKP